MPSLPFRRATSGPPQPPPNSGGVRLQQRRPSVIDRMREIETTQAAVLPEGGIQATSASTPGATAPPENRTSQLKPQLTASCLCFNRMYGAATSSDSADAVEPGEECTDRRHSARPLPSNAQLYHSFYIRPGAEKPRHSVSEARASGYSRPANAPSDAAMDDASNFIANRRASSNPSRRSIRRSVKPSAAQLKRDADAADAAAAVARTGSPTGAMPLARRPSIPGSAPAVAWHAPTINPFDPRKRLWDLLTLALALYTFFVAPFALAFLRGGLDEHGGLPLGAGR